MNDKLQRNLTHQKTWWCRYKELGIVIKLTYPYPGTPQRSHWCAYLRIPEEDMPDDWLPEKHPVDPKDPKWSDGEYQYTESPWAELPWHGGVTFFARETHNRRASYLIGCDYNHLHDRDRHYTLEQVLADTLAVADAYLEQTGQNPKNG